MSFENIPFFIEELNNIENESRFSEVITQLEDSLSFEQIAVLLEAFPIPLRKSIWQSITTEVQQQVFLEMRTESRQLLLNACDDFECFPLFEKLDADELLDLSENLSDRFVDYAVSKMTAKQRGLFKRSQEYSTEEVGHWQSYDDIQVPERVKVSAAKKICSKVLPPLSEAFYITRTDATLIGEMAIASIIAIDNDCPIASLVDATYEANNEAIETTENIYTAINKVIASGKAALPVIDSSGFLTGRLDLHQAYKIKEQQKETQLIQLAGLVEEEDLFSNIWRSSKNRAVWLGINLITAFLASWFIGRFEGTLQQVVALAVLMPIVASMGGISGSQTLTLIIRGLALGQITEANQKAIVTKELKVGCINGLLWASVIATLTYLWFANPLLSLAIFFAILGNIIIASFSGVWVPWLLDKLKIDPALAASVILTTVTDIFGFVTFLGLGSLLLT
ncbi:MAG: magnesium transporter [Psychromonas sp.]|jgi:magnesium transporter|uniref:magnesium transporter n=1 Tax=Psychromonas sp. TaxID=1884585 RepID=UPI0039E4D7C0